MARKRRKLTKQYKAEVIKLVRESGKMPSEVCRDLDLVQSAVSSWVRQADIDDGHGPAGALTSAE